MKYHVEGATMTAGPTLSPVAALCFAWLPSQAGNFVDNQHRHATNFSPAASV